MKKSIQEENGVEEIPERKFHEAFIRPCALAI